MKKTNRAIVVLFLTLAATTNCVFADEALNAFDKLDEAARSGSVDAQRSLGDAYYLGQGTRKDYTQAREWYAKAARQGDSEAQHNLGDIYHLGQGVSKDSSQAAYWYEKACDSGIQMACESLEE